MGLISLLNGDRIRKGIVSPGQRGQTDILGLEFDAILSDRHELTAKITQNVVEFGSTISDHINRNPERVILNCMVTNTPVGLLKALRVIGSNPVQEAQTFLEALFNKGELFDLVVGLKVHEGMAMSALTFNRIPATGASLEWTMTVQKVTVVESQTVGTAEAQIEAPAGSSASQKQSLGKQPTAAAGASAERGSSILFSVLGL